MVNPSLSFLREGLRQPPLRIEQSGHLEFPDYWIKHALIKCLSPVNFLTSLKHSIEMEL